mgnify:CR=1 FL=1
MRKAKERKLELKRVRTRNKIAKKDKQKNRVADNAVIREEMGSDFQIISDIVYTFTPKESLVL